MAAKFRVFCRTLLLKPEGVEAVVKTFAVLHNYLRNNKKSCIEDRNNEQWKAAINDACVWSS